MMSEWGLKQRLEPPKVVLELISWLIEQRLIWLAFWVWLSILESVIVSHKAALTCEASLWQAFRMKATYRAYQFIIAANGQLRQLKGLGGLLPTRATLHREIQI